jgi:hypothetical protein
LSKPGGGEPGFLEAFFELQKAYLAQEFSLPKKHDAAIWIRNQQKRLRSFD